MIELLSNMYKVQDESLELREKQKQEKKLKQSDQFLTNISQLLKIRFEARKTAQWERHCCADSPECPALVGKLGTVLRICHLNCL